MPDGLYERDILQWSEEQARLLQRLAAGESVNAAVDWANVIEGVQDVGVSSLKACESLLRQAMIHLLKLHAWPRSRSAGHWADEAAAFLDDARSWFSPAMRQRIDLGDGFRRAAKRVRRMSDRSGPPRPWPDACPWTLDDLLHEDADPLALVAMLGGSHA